MELRAYRDAAEFLGQTQAALEASEAANCLMLGISLRLAQHPERIGAPPYLRTVSDGEGLVLAALMTPPHKLILYGQREDLAQGCRVLAQDLLAAGRGLPGVLAPQAVAQSLALQWHAVTGQRHRIERRLQAFELRQVAIPAPARGRLRVAGEDEVPLIARWQYAFSLDTVGQADQAEARHAAALRIGDGDVYMWEEEQPVSMAARNRPTRHGVSVSYVYTPPEHRRRGYATACVAELSRRLLQAGHAFCGLFADMDNPTAMRIYRHIGYEPVCVYAEYAFG